MQTVTIEPYYPNLLKFFAQAASEAAGDFKRCRGAKQAREHGQRLLKLAGARDEVARYLNAVWKEKYPEIENDYPLRQLLEAYGQPEAE